MSTGLNDPNKCQWCGGFHQAKCPMVKSIEYFEDSPAIKRVTFYSPKDYALTAMAAPNFTAARTT